MYLHKLLKIIHNKIKTTIIDRHRALSIIVVIRGWKFIVG